jgi:exonuclease III
MFWNCRGLGNYATIRELCTLVAQNRPSVLCVLETQVQNNRVKNLARSLGFDNCYAVSSDGRKGGIAMYWNNNLTMELIHYSQYHIDMIVHEQNKEDWRLTCIYGEAIRQERYKTWNLLKFLRSESDLPWVCGGISMKSFVKKNISV